MSAAQIKLTETWKASNDDQYPVKMRKERRTDEEASMRSVRTGTRREMEEGGRLKIAQDSFTRDAGKLWNSAPNSIREAKSISGAKKAIKEYCKTLPI